MTINKQKNKLPPFAPILNEEMLSPAYISLSPNAAKALPHFKRLAAIAHKAAKQKNVPVPYTPFDFNYEEAIKFGFAKRTFSRVINELNNKGFIIIVEQGGLRSTGKTNSKYRLSERWREYGKSPVYDRVAKTFRDQFVNVPRYKQEPD